MPLTILGSFGSGIYKRGKADRSSAARYGTGMRVTVEIPDKFASFLVPEGEAASRHFLEDRTAKTYRDGRLTAYQVQCILELPTRMHVDPFLMRYGIADYTVEMLADDLSHLEQLHR